MGPIHIIQTKQDLAKFVEIFEAKIQHSIDFASSTFPITDSRDHLPAHIKALIKKKRKAAILAQNSWNPVHRRTANQLKNQVANELCKHHSDSWQSKLESFNCEDNSAWRMVKALRLVPTSIPPLQSAFGLATTDLEKAEAFADALEIQWSTVHKS